MKVHFVSLNNEWLSEVKHLFGNNPERFEYTQGDIQTIWRDRAIFVSPANSLGFMDGGIDDVLRKMFPGIEARVKAKIAEIGLKTNLGRPYLPVGSAILFSVNAEINTAMITAPTMFLPHDVSQTRNAYYSFLAALILFKRYEAEYDTLVVTSHCCGYGKMNPKESAMQFRQAYYDFYYQNYIKPIPDGRDNVLLMPSVDHEQPSNYDNREIGVPF